MPGSRVKVRFWGVRGSIPVPGSATSTYGGNSSCIEVRADGLAPIVLDCGTGARALGRELILKHESHVYVLFTHFHMDHLFGFPFFEPIFSPNCAVDVAVPAYSGVDAQNKLGRYLNGIYHPLRIHDVAARLGFEGVRPGRPFDRGPYTIQGVALNHPGGSCGYRVTYGNKSVAYLTDTAPLSRPDEGLSADKPPPAPEIRVLDCIKEADLLIMDTMFGYDEFLEKMTWGHGYPEYAVALAKAAGVKKLALFHHAPDATDGEMAALEARWARYDELPVIVAKEGMVVDLEG
jgi:phosphoribosyl 1,2-cyclic phosphodiesterase